MGVSQTKASFQNDGNFSQLDIQDTAIDGPILRIETFRCSQPEGDFGVTASGTGVRSIAGADHLSDESNRVFRHVFSVGSGDDIGGKLEIRETFDEDGNLEVRTRDIDGQSNSFGWTLVSSVQPTQEGINVQYRLLKAECSKGDKISSPISIPISEQLGLPDINADVDLLGVPFPVDGDELLEIQLTTIGSNAAVFERLDAYGSALREFAPRWSANVKTYERMGDFRDKCIHPGTNLTGDHVALASEFVLIRAYRKSLIMLGRVFDDEMAAGVESLNVSDALSVDPKPGVYSVFLAAYGLNIGHYQLGIDKVHSDYGGIPMALKPGSRLETAAIPIVDATSVNRVLAVTAALFYAPSSLRNVVETKPAISSFEPLVSIGFLTD